MGRPSQVIVLAEDERHQRFIRHYLRRLGYTGHDIRAEPRPAGRGCGEQWVRDRYSKAVAEYRLRSARVKTSLIVAIDADKSSVEQRLRQLSDALVQANLKPRSGAERIVHTIPRRNIETWILFLNGTDVNEINDYKHAPGVDTGIPSAAATFFVWSRPNAPPPMHAVPSLLSAIPEVKRLE